MGVVDLYSYRKRVADGTVPDVFVYDELPQDLLVQVVHIWRDAIGPYSEPHPYNTSQVPSNNAGWRLIRGTVARERGLLELSGGSDLDKRCEKCLLDTPLLDVALDLIDATFIYLDRVARRFDRRERERRGIRLTPDEAIAELNVRFQRAGVGFQFEGGMLMRIDSDLIHSEVVRPALQYLNHKGFEGPRDEYRKAHAHYRAGETKAAVTEANNAFESTLKAICDHRRWPYPKGARASDLLKAVRDNRLLPDYLDASFDQLAATLKSGLPKVRGDEGSHGQGATPRETPGYVAAYALHLAAANIVFLVEAHQAME